VYSKKGKKKKDRRKQSFTTGVKLFQGKFYLCLFLGVAHHDRHLLLQVANNVCMHLGEAHALHQLVDLAHRTEKKQ